METEKNKNQLMSIALTTKFIEAYRKEPCLWKRDSPYYGHTNDMNKAYDRLALFLINEGVDANRNFVINKIFLLNNCWKYEYKKMNKPTNGFKYKTTLWYFDLLSFAHADDPFTPEYGSSTSKNTNYNYAMYEDKWSANLFKNDLIANNFELLPPKQLIGTIPKSSASDNIENNSNKLENDILSNIRDKKETICLFRKSISDMSEINNVDEYDAFGNVLANKLRKIGTVSSTQLMICENILNNLLIGALRGKLTDLSDIVF